MSSRSQDLIAALQLTPHPEGGYFRQIYRSSSRVQPIDSRPERAALTTIYFLLAAGDTSRWHKVGSDEVWHYYEGEPLELLVADEGFNAVHRHVLGPLGAASEPVHVVPAGMWQAARSRGVYTLVGCTVGPGFEFSDFQLLRDSAAEAARFAHIYPELTSFI